jgi:hypothetical protein
MSKYFTPQQIEQIVADTEREIEASEAADFEQQRMRAIIAWINDPRNKATIDADPRVKALRAMPMRGASATAQHSAPVQRTVGPATTPAPTGYKSRQQLEKERPWLAPRKPELESIIDPMAGRKPNRI